MTRVPTVTDNDLPPAAQDLLVSALQGTELNIYRAVGNNPAVLYGLRTFLGTLWRDSGLGPAQRELVILAVARASDSVYIWHQHVSIARSEGVSDGDIRAVSAGDFEVFDTGDRTLLTYATAVAEEMVDDDCHALVAEIYPPETVVGIATLASGYVFIARLLDALGVEPESPFVGWQLETDS